MLAVDDIAGDGYQKYCQTVIDEENVDEVLKNFVMKSEISGGII